MKDIDNPLDQLRLEFIFLQEYNLRPGFFVLFLLSKLQAFLHKTIIHHKKTVQSEIDRLEVETCGSKPNKQVFREFHTVIGKYRAFPSDGGIITVCFSE